MLDACNLALYLINGVLAAVPDSPMMFVFGLAIVCVAFRLIIEVITIY